MQIGKFQFGFAKPEKTNAKPPTDAVGVAASLLYRAGDFTYYNPDDLVQRQGYQVFKKMMRDEQVKAVYRFRRNSITGRRWLFKFEPEVADQLSEEEQERRIQVFNRSITKVRGNFRRVMNKVLSSMTYGFSLNEKVFAPFELEGKAYWGLRELLYRDPESIEFEIEDTGQLIKVKQRQDARVIPLDPARFIHHVHNPEEDDYYGLSELREAYRMWWSKDIAIKLRNIFLERLAGGLVWVQPKADSPMTVAPGSATYTQLQNVLTTLTTKTGMILPRDIDFNVEMPRDARAFEEAIKSYDKGISKAALMPNLLGLSEQGDTGSYAQSQTQLEAFLWMLDGEAADLEETLNEQLFKDIGDYNFGDGLYPNFTFYPLSKEMIHKVASIWGDLVTKGAVTASDTDEEYLRDMLEFPEKGEPREQPQPQPMPGEEDDPGMPDPEDGEEPNPDDVDEPLPAQAETIAGRSWTEISISAKRKMASHAIRRVDFVAIDTSGNVAETVYEDELSSSMAKIVKHMTDAIRTNDALLTDPDEVTKLKVPNSATSALRKQSTKMLQNGWDLGTTHAKRELTKAGKQVNNDFTKKFATLSDIAANYFKAKSFRMAGTFSQDALTTIQNILFNGIKFSKTQDQVVKEIYTTFAQKGMLNPADIDDVEDLLAEAMAYDNPTSRLRTAIRTNYFEAVNEARFGMFTDSDLAGFVVALTYSATLDSRVTEICRELDERTYPLGSDLWDKYRPPNHFNCRSILIPVTQQDQVAITQDLPNVEPQEGFG